MTVTCRKCGKQYVGNTTTACRLRFNNHKSSINRCAKGRSIGGQHLYEDFFDEGHLGFKAFLVQVIDVTDVNNPNERESFWMEKLKTYAPMGFINNIVVVTHVV